MSRRSLLRYGAGAAASAVVLPALARAGLRASDGSASRRLAEAAGSYSYNLWSFDGAPEVAQVKQYEAAYNKLGRSQITLKFSTLAGSGATLYPSKIQSLISSGTPPDLFEDWVGSLAAPFIAEGAVRPLTAWYAKYGWHKLLNPLAVDYCSVGGKPYGVPTALNTVPVWYNKTLFAKADVAVPTTYDEWETVNKKLLKAGITPAGEAAIDGWDVMRLFEHLLEVTAGPKLHDQLLALETSWNTPAVVEAFSLFKKWSDQGWLEKGWIGTNPNDSVALFTAGKCAQQLQGPWGTLNITSAGANLANFGVFAPPGDKRPARLAGFAQQYLISTHVTGARLDALGDFWNWFIQPAQSQKYFYAGSTATNGGLPAGNTAADVLAHAIFNFAAKYGGYLIMDEALSPQLIDKYFTLQVAVGGDKMTPQDAAAQMQKFAAASMKK